MPTFSDNTNTEWEIRLITPDVMRIRADCDPQFMLNDAVDNNSYMRLQADPALLCRVVFLLCDKQRVERGISDEAFYRNVLGNAIDSATAALLQAMMAFSPSRTRGLLESSAAKHDRVHEAVAKRVLARINDRELEDKMLANLDQRLDDVVDAVLELQASETAAGETLAAVAKL